MSGVGCRMLDTLLAAWICLRLVMFVLVSLFLCLFFVAVNLIQLPKKKNCSGGLDIFFVT
jgi:hypothetical protein